MGLIERLFGPSERSAPPWDLLDFLNFNNNLYPLGLNTTIPGQKQEEIAETFAGYVQGAFKSNGIVFACILARMLLFSEARFQYQRMTKGRPGDLWGDASLDILEHPWPGGTTGDLLSRALFAADMGGEAFMVRGKGAIKLARPDWMTIVLGSQTDGDVDAWDVEAEVLGYLYHPGGRNSGEDPVVYQRTEVAHYAPIPDPMARYRGMSWLTPIIREVMGDSAARDHKLLFFENGATPNLVVKRTAPAPLAPDKWIEWARKFKEAEPAGRQAYKTLLFDADMESTIVGANLRQMDFKVTQGAGETRIAAAAGVPPIVVGLSEGLSAATYSNYGQAMRRFADLWARPMWRNFAGSLETIVPPPGGSRLWYDARDVSALRADAKDEAEVHTFEAQQIRTLTDAGYTPESVVKAVMAGDFGLLAHDGLYSVQLQPPGTVAPTVSVSTPAPKQIPAKATPPKPANGKAKRAEELLAPLLEKP